MAGAGEIQIDQKARKITVGGKTFKHSDTLSIDGSTGEVMVGSVPTKSPKMSSSFVKLMKWADKYRRLRVRTNADTPADSKRAREFGAEGIGLCRTEHMFFQEDRISAMREMIVADREGQRRWHSRRRVDLRGRNVNVALGQPAPPLGGAAPMDARRNARRRPMMMMSASATTGLIRSPHRRCRQTGRRPPWRSLALGVALIAALPTLALGQAPQSRDAVSKEVRTEAERFFRAGERAYNAGQYVIAAQAFEESYALLPLPALAFSTAQAYRLQYFIDKEPPRLKRAVALYRVYLDAVAKGGRRDDAARSSRSSSRYSSAWRRSRKPAAWRRFRSGQNRSAYSAHGQHSGEGAMASVDGGEPKAVPLIQQVSPGAHEVVVTADGYFPATMSQTAVEASRRRRGQDEPQARARPVARGRGRDPHG